MNAPAHWRVPADPPKPSKPVRLIDMTYELIMEARSLRETQELCVQEGLRKKADPERIRRAEVFEAASRFLEKIQPVLGQVIDLIKSAEGAKANVERGHDGGERGKV